MKVAEIMTKNPAFATLDTSLHDVAQMMLENDCGCIPVTENEENRKPLGMITDRDIAIRTVAHNKNPLNMIAGEVMTDSVVTVTPDANIEECVGAMERNQIRRIAVVDETGNLCGIVAQADIARTAPLYETAELVKDVSAHAA
jgi:CBS domain-containing protein